jgi:hypothetical protein
MLTVMFTVLDVAKLPAASYARAVQAWLPFCDSLV